MRKVITTAIFTAFPALGGVLAVGLGHRLSQPSVTLTMGDPLAMSPPWTTSPSIIFKSCGYMDACPKPYKIIRPDGTEERWL